MSDAIDRDELIRLLDALGGADDADVLAAARALHEQVAATDLDWDELIIDDVPADDSVEDTSDPITEEDDQEPESSEAGASSKKSKDSDTLALIEKMLASPGRSEALREELEEYKADIANGEFAARDHQYVRALYSRLSK